ncbi:tRNA pseudouridine synthase 1, partial [Nowakowskiella sp. JEL0078]
MLEVTQINAILPPQIKVYSISRPNLDFSARRSCDARTYEYLVPTYVFSPPPSNTLYCNPYIDEPIPEDLHVPNETLFKTLRRGGNTQRRPTVPSSAPQAPQINRQASQPAHLDDGKKTGTISRFIQSLKRPVKSEIPKSSGSKIIAAQNEEIENEEPIMSTIKRSLSRKNNNRSKSATREGEVDRRFVEDQEALYNAEPIFYDPLELPRSEENNSELRRYRISQNQYDLLQHIVGLFRGTHNFHNYIPGATYEDPRCYMRILNIECSRPEEHAGMEWVRIKVQAKAFARFQIRKMIGKTNTPRSILGNSFGFAKIDIPEAPGHALILDETHYEGYNEKAGLSNGVNFTEYASAIEGFRKPAIHNAIYTDEYENMNFEEWVRSIDRFSFLYMYYLNPRG